MRCDIEEAALTISSVVPGLISGAELEFFSKARLTNCQFIAIMAISLCTRCTMGQLARMLNVTMPTVSGLVDRLVKLRLVKRVFSEEDRRKVYIELSDKGHSLIADFKGMIKRRWTKLLNTLSPADIKNFQRIFEELKDSMEKEKNVPEK